MDETTKTALLEQFRGYLETLEEEEAPAPGNDLPGIDLHTLFTELAGLRNEVKLESRQVKQALDHSRELVDALQENNRRLSGELSALRRAEEELREEAQRELLLELLELRDRLADGARHIRAFTPRGLVERFLFGRAKGRIKPLIAGTGEGLEMGLRRIDALLQRNGVRPIESRERKLDPMRMQAVSVTHDPSREEGVVVNELRRGYLRGGKVLRLAEVVVNKQDANI